ncbi:hypothetical protein Aduo_016981 [Ancylostoma duodenale]
MSTQPHHQMIRTLSCLTGVVACAFYLLPIAFSAEASKYQLPDCYAELGGNTTGKRVRELLYHAIVTAMKSGDTKYSCELEKVARELAKEGSAAMPERKALYDEGPKHTLNLKKAVAQWEDWAKLRTMGKMSEFGCNLLFGRYHYRVACVFQ